jgi:ferrochelatase
MSFQTEPPHQHGSADRTAVLMVNLGTPDAATAPALRRYLAEFLWDRRVVEIPRALWWLILHGVILRTRPAKSAAKYASVWRKEGSPLLYWTQRQSLRLQGQLGERGHQVLVRHAMRYGNPSVASALDALKAEGATRILVMPMYPQYSGATTASTSDAVAQWSLQVRRLPELRHLMRYHDDPGYIDALAESVRRHWKAHGRGQKLVMSFHGMPARSLPLGDPYHCECHATARLLAARLGLQADDWLITFQSRFGRAKWLEPYTEPTVKQLASRGVQAIDVVCPGFAVDCLETLEEVAMEIRDAFIAAGGKTYQYIPCLNDSDRWIAALADLAERHLQGWPTGADGSTPPAERAKARERALALGAKN